MLVWWPRLCSLVVSCQSEWFHVLNLLVHVYNEISACTWWLFTVSVVYRCFRQKSHLIKCVSYAYVAPMLHQLVGEKACRDTIKSIANKEEFGHFWSNSMGRSCLLSIDDHPFLPANNSRFGDSICLAMTSWRIKFGHFLPAWFLSGMQHSHIISMTSCFLILLSGGKPKKSHAWTDAKASTPTSAATDHHHHSQVCLPTNGNKVGAI